MPVHFRVRVIGFEPAERRELEVCFGPRSLIGYLPAASLDAADLVVVDGDDPAALAPLVTLQPRRPALLIGGPRTDGSHWHLPRPVDGAAALRALDELVAAVRPAPHAISDGLLSLVNRHRGAVVAAAVGAEALAPATGEPPRAPDRRARKAEKRAAVRRAQQGSLRDPPPVSAHVLVVEAHAPTRLLLGDLLGSFGFLPVTVATQDHAERALRDRPYAVVFLGSLPASGEAPEAGDAAAIDLCHRLHTGAVALPHALPKLVMVWQRSRPADRVRARLAGCDHFVTGTASRGLVARALEAVGVAMPQDPRGRAAAVAEPPPAAPVQPSASDTTTGA